MLLTKDCAAKLVRACQKVLFVVLLADVAMQSELMKSMLCQVVLMVKTPKGRPIHICFCVHFRSHGEFRGSCARALDAESGAHWHYYGDIPGQVERQQTDSIQEQECFIQQVCMLLIHPPLQQLV